MRFKVRTRYDEERLNAALLQLESALALPAPPLRIECYDISTLHGRWSVGSMVVFSQRPRGLEGLSPVPGPNARRGGQRRRDDARGAPAPVRPRASRRRALRLSAGLVVVDGGKPQLSAALAAMAEVGVEDIPVVGLAKREEELWVPWSDQPVVLPAGSPSLFLVKRIRDEAHRFAIEYHRNLRGKSLTASALDDVPGVGPEAQEGAHEGVR